MKVRCMALTCIVFLAAFSSISVPPIQDAAQLVKDSDAIQPDGTAHVIPKEKWPPTIVALHPIYVSKEDDGIHITTYAETGVGSSGYVISHIIPVNSGHVVITVTAYPNIYRFDFRP